MGESNAMEWSLQGRQQCCLGWTSNQIYRNLFFLKQRSFWNRRIWQMSARVDKGGVIVAALGWQGVLREGGRGGGGDSRELRRLTRLCDGVIVTSRRKIASGERPDPHITYFSNMQQLVLRRHFLSSERDTVLIDQLCLLLLLKITVLVVFGYSWYLFFGGQCTLSPLN